MLPPACISSSAPPPSPPFSHADLHALLPPPLPPSPSLPPAPYPPLLQVYLVHGWDWGRLTDAVPANTWSPLHRPPPLPPLLQVYLVHGRDWGRLTDAVPAKSLAQIKTYYQNYKVRKDSSVGSGVGPRFGRCGGGGGGRCGIQCGQCGCGFTQADVRSHRSDGLSLYMMFSPLFMTPSSPPV